MSDLPWHDLATAVSVPEATAKAADLINNGDVRKTPRVRIRKVNLKLFNLHNNQDVIAYERLRLKLFNKLETGAVLIYRDEARILSAESGQRLYHLLEWADVEFKVDKIQTSPSAGTEKPDADKASY